MKNNQSIIRILKMTSAAAFILLGASHLRGVPCTGSGNGSCTLGCSWSTYDLFGQTMTGCSGCQAISEDSQLWGESAAGDKVAGSECNDLRDGQGGNEGNCDGICTLYAGSCGPWYIGLSNEKCGPDPQ